MNVRNLFVLSNSAPIRKVIASWYLGSSPSCENGVQHAVVTELIAATIERRPSATWFHVPNEGKRGKLAGAILRLLGVISGVSDLIFLWDTGSGVIELKYGNNKLSKNQENFIEWCESNGVQTAVCYSPQAVFDVLGGWGIYRPNK